MCHDPVMASASGMCKDPVPAGERVHEVKYAGDDHAQERGWRTASTKLRKEFYLKDLLTAKEMAALSVGADGRPCVSRDTEQNQLVTSIPFEIVKHNPKRYFFSGDSVTGVSAVTAEPIYPRIPKLPSLLSLP